MKATGKITDNTILESRSNLHEKLCLFNEITKALENGIKFEGVDENLEYVKYVLEQEISSYVEGNWCNLIAYRIGEPRYEKNS
ncbi:hypothetical protein [Ralstonia pickettii]|uniref:hypothetical protein n=1 Tax=Ralstonia pickettii TaxID=329 RepID=UPI002D78DF3A|nr:hypothetical protein [Ralstonia pickettii]